jgi:hypothetical protein
MDMYFHYNSAACSLKPNNGNKTCTWLVQHKFTNSGWKTSLNIVIDCLTQGMTVRSVLGLLWSFEEVSEGALSPKIVQP